MTKKDREEIRKIIREELDKKLTIKLSDILATSAQATAKHAWAVVSTMLPPPTSAQATKEE